MRRKDREVHDINEIRNILDMCKTAHVAMVDNGMPYVVPLSYGYELENGRITLYFHCAKEGRKIDIMKANNRVCFEISCEGEPLHAAETPCNSGYYYSSIIGNGRAEFIDDVEEKCKGLSIMFRRQTGKEVAFTAKQAESVCVFKIVSDDFSGKQKPKK